MKNKKFSSPEERRVYNAGYSAGYTEGLKKAAMLIQLVASDSDEFEESILQNSQEVVELRKIMTK